MTWDLRLRDLKLDKRTMGTSRGWFFFNFWRILRTSLDNRSTSSTNNRLQTIPHNNEIIKIQVGSLRAAAFLHIVLCSVLMILLSSLWFLPSSPILSCSLHAQKNSRNVNERDTEFQCLIWSWLHHRNIGFRWLLIMLRVSTHQYDNED